MEEMSFEFFLFVALASILCSGADRFEKDLVEDFPRNNSSFVEIRQVVMEMLFEVFFLFLALIAILYSREEHIEQFW